MVMLIDEVKKKCLTTTEVSFSDFELELPECFNERHSFNISDCSAEFDNAKIWWIIRSVNGLHSD
jgi:hypothetical protein